MESVSSRLDSRVDYSSASPSEFRAKVAGLDFEFLNRIWLRQVRVGRTVQKIDRVVVVINAVEKIVVVDGRQPVGHKTPTCIESPRWIQAGHTSTKLRQEGVITPTQRKIIDLNSGCDHAD